PSVSDTLASVLKETPDWGQVPPELRRLVRACLVRDPRQRMRDIGDARLLIAAPLPAAPAPGTVAQPVPAFPRWNIAISILGRPAGRAAALTHCRRPVPEPAAARYQIPRPEKRHYATGGIARCPDGKRIAFIGTAAGGGTMLWVGSVDSLEPRGLQETEGAAV